MTSQIYEARDGQRLKIDSAAAGKLAAFRQLGSGATEAGGVLIGRWIAGREDVVVDEVTGPMRGDKRSRCGFFRSHHEHQHAIDCAYKISHGTAGYLGEWHTHPERSPQPSSIDTKDWLRRLREDAVDVKFVYFAIVGTAETRVWRGSRVNKTLELMERDVLNENSPESGRSPLGESWRSV